MPALDDIDHRILRELTCDARQPNLALAERIGLSPSACLRRVQALERAGVIRSYCAVLDPEKLGIGFVAYVTVGLNAHTKAAQDSFEHAVSRAPQVRECHNITGTVEYLLQSRLPRPQRLPPTRRRMPHGPKCCTALIVLSRRVRHFGRRCPTPLNRQSNACSSAG